MSVAAAPARLPAGGMIRFYEAVNIEGAVTGGGSGGLDSLSNVDTVPQTH